MASALLPSARSARTSGPVGSSSATRSCPSPVTLTCTYAIYDGRKSNVEWPQPLVRQDPMAKRKINCHRTSFPACFLVLSRCLVSGAIGSEPATGCWPWVAQFGGKTLCSCGCSSATGC